MSRNSGMETSDWLMGVAKRNPEGLLLLAAGFALMMRSGNSSPRTERRPMGDHSEYTGNGDSTQRQGNKFGESVSQAAESASHYASDMKDKVSQTASSYASSVAGYADDARRSVSQHSGRIARQAGSTMQGALDGILRDQPLAVVVAGLAAGAAVAATFPATEIEKRTLGGAGDKLTEAAGKAGEQLKGATAKAGELLKSAAEERGLTSEGFKEVARDVAGLFSDALSGEQSGKAGQSGEAKNAAASLGQSGQSGGTGSSHSPYGAGASTGQSGASGQMQGSNRPSQAGQSTAGTGRTGQSS